MVLNCKSFLLIGLLFLQVSIYAQSPILTEREVVSELEKRGLNRAEVEEELIRQGIDITSLQDVTPEEIKIIQDVILEFENRGNQGSKSQVDKFDLDDKSENLPESDTVPLPIEEFTSDDIEQIKSNIYGHDIFREELLKRFDAENEISATDNYVLGVGDQITLSIWGRSSIEKEYTINQEGYIIITNGTKRVFLKGLTLGNARKKLESIMSQFYNFSDGELDLKLSQSRTVTISIYGQVIKPGPVTLSALNNAFTVISESMGPTELGSVRNIKLIKADGKIIQLDVYKYMNNPISNPDLYLDDNDVIHIPIQENIVEVVGAVKRPMKYELLKDEGILDLISFAGGVNQNAILKTIRILRYEDDKQIITDLDFREVQRSGRNELLIDGDKIMVDTITSFAKNFVEVQGEVTNPGIFERTSNMKVSDVVDLSGLKSESRTDIAFIKRKNSDGTTSFQEINLDNIINNKASQENILLNDEDVLTIWPKERFVDNAVIKIDGAVRYPDSIPYDVSNKVKIREAIILAGGLRRDASNYATIFKKDPLNPKLIEYVTVTDLESILSDPSINDNIELSPYDSIYIYSDNTFLEESFVSIYGAVNNPGKFQFGKEMNIEDLIVLAGGFKLSSATNNVEVSRVQIKDNQPTNVVVAKLDIDRKTYQAKGHEQGYKLEPFDRIAVRYVPEFELQESVILKGEVTSPGAYAIVGENEKISSIINRAGGLTREAFPEGASLNRAEGELGAIVVKLNDIFENDNSVFDFIVRGGDTINIPKQREFVTIKGATNVWEVLSSESINQGNEIHVPYHRNKNALFYLNNYAGGFNKSANKKSLVVQHPNGEVKRIQNFGLFNKYPEVKQGSIISVSFKTTEDNELESKEKVDWTRVLGDSVGQAMSILTLLLLIQRLD